MVARPPDLAEAYRACERMARAHYENFPVASLLLPADMRPHVAALYAFARTADDFADEGDRSPEEREALLDQWARLLDEAVRSGSSHLSGASDENSSANSPIWPPLPESATVPILATANTIRERNLPLPLFHDLLSAFRQDVRVKRYDTWNDVLDYCRRSANPVGRLVLRIGGYASPELDRESDAVCTALQLTNFWQDLERDWQKGRLYVPADDRAAAGAREEDLDRRAWTPEWRHALARVAARTRELFADGRPITGHVEGRLKWELRLTWLGGVRILDSLERRGFNVFDKRPALSVAAAPSLVWHTLVWRTRGA
jgi:squalene synthase HpnC